MAMASGPADRSDALWYADAMPRRADDRVREGLEEAAADEPISIWAVAAPS